MTLEQVTEHVRVHGVRAAVLALHAEPAIVLEEGELVANPLCQAIVQTVGELASTIQTHTDETPGNRHGHYVEFDLATHIRDIVVECVRCRRFLFEVEGARDGGMGGWVEGWRSGVS